MTAEPGVRVLSSTDKTAKAQITTVKAQGQKATTNHKPNLNDSPIATMAWGLELSITCIRRVGLRLSKRGER